MPYMWKSYLIILSSVAFQDLLGGSDSKEFTCNAGDLCLIPRLERSLEKEQLQYSVLEIQ